MMNSLLTNEDVWLIKELWEEKHKIRRERDRCNHLLRELTQSKIAEKFDVPETVIKSALHRRV